MSNPIVPTALPWAQVLDNYVRNPVVAAQFQPQSEANNIQHGGDHYKKYGDLQPWDVVAAWNMDYFTGTALKYLARWKDKGGVQDLEKAIHFLQKKIELETK